MMKRVLYVEDEQHLQEMVKLVLEGVCGFMVKICSSGPEAIEFAPAFEPDIMLLDVMMPEMDGITTCAELRKNPKLTEVPVIFMTAMPIPRDEERMKKIGGASVIYKPFDPMMLPHILRGVLEGRDVFPEEAERI